MGVVDGDSGRPQCVFTATLVVVAQHSFPCHNLLLVEKLTRPLALVLVTLPETCLIRKGGGGGVG